jgi:hypothetical protein
MSVYLHLKKPEYWLSAPRNNQNTGKMKYKKIINFQALSEELTGNKTTIRADRQTKKYLEQLQDLDELIEAWIKCTKRRLK